MNDDEPFLSIVFAYAQAAISAYSADDAPSEHREQAALQEVLAVHRKLCQEIAELRAQLATFLATPAETRWCLTCEQWSPCDVCSKTVNAPAVTS